jgi:hypothetical protein
LASCLIVDRARPRSVSPRTSTSRASCRASRPALHQFGYLAVLGLVFLEDFGVPVPGETVLILLAPADFDPWTWALIERGLVIACGHTKRIVYPLSRVSRVGRWLTRGTQDPARVPFRPPSRLTAMPPNWTYLQAIRDGERRTRTADTTIFSRASSLLSSRHLQGFRRIRPALRCPRFPALCGRLPSERAHGGVRGPLRCGDGCGGTWSGDLQLALAGDGRRAVTSHRPWLRRGWPRPRRERARAPSLRRSGARAAAARRSGEKTSRTNATWLGWMQRFAVQPSARAYAADWRKRSASPMGPTGPSMAPRPAARACTTTAHRPCPGRRLVTRVAEWQVVAPQVSCEITGAQCHGGDAW